MSTKKLDEIIPDRKPISEEMRRILDLVVPFKTKRILIDIIVDPCLCNLVVWVETDVDGWDLHISAKCSSCRKIGLEAAEKALGKLPPVTFEDQ